jgi:hypothetical protein
VALRSPKLLLLLLLWLWLWLLLLLLSLSLLLLLLLLLLLVVVVGRAVSGLVVVSEMNDMTQARSDTQEEVAISWPVGWVGRAMQRETYRRWQCPGKPANPDDAQSHSICERVR